MHRGLKLRILCSLTVLLAVPVVATPGWAGDAASPRATYVSVADRAGDVRDDDSAPLKDARGDILGASAGYDADLIKLEVRVA